MEITTQKYVRKPIYVDAVRVTEENFDDLVAWCQGEVLQERNRKYIKIRVHNPKYVRQTKAFVGDWILYTDFGYKIYTNRNFLTSFERLPKRVDPPLSSEPIIGYDEARQNAGYQPIKDGSAQTPEESVGRTKDWAAVPATSENTGGYPEETTIGGIPREEINLGISEPNEESLTTAHDLTAKGQRVLSVEEQKTLTVDEIREMLKSGEVVLAQDITAQA